MIEDYELELVGNTTQHLIELPTGHFIHKLALGSFEQMQSAALQDGIKLTIASSFRDFQRQLAIWNNKFSGKTPVYDRNNQTIEMSQLDDWQKARAILTYSALPGTSRHHWGTDMDVFDKATIDEAYSLKLTPDEYSKNGPFYHLACWLNNNANKFGFYLPYLTDKGGVAIEPWHLSYQRVAKQYQHRLKQSSECLEKALVNSEIMGKHAILEHLPDILQQYVFNITDYNEAAQL